VQTPEPWVASLNALSNTPVSASLSPQGEPVPGMLSNVATLTRTSLPTNANQANIQPVYEVFANLQGRDLGSVAGEIDRAVAGLQEELSPGNSIQVLGQIGSMKRRLPRSGHRARLRCCLRLFADGRELSEFR